MVAALPGVERAGPAPVDAVRAAVMALLQGVVDPEIPAISIVDLGIVRAVSLVDGELGVELLPTFIGCPALELIQAGVRERLAPLAGEEASGIERITVSISYAEAWTADRISARGRAALVASGFAPPGGGPQLLALSAPATCPFCGSRRTVLENAFGPTRCRSIHYCTSCRQPFEQFKDG
ncbi:MAG TPA: 1,2-phenylacetyl-CoA epoxidase subunit PaaD [Candidatus Limnocylindrales bacterium]|nr:1,2-phenylacetyl-CoA epoxidase subunit PaaD [Candidatus Limnocylindrales bacterium]